MSKGPTWERRICCDLSLWFSGGDKEADWFWRTAGSGGRSTVRRKKGKSADKHCGDVCATDERGVPLTRVFAIECKKGYSKHSIQDVLDAPVRKGESVPQEWGKWMAQAEAARVNSNALYWLIIAKRDKREPLVAFPEPFHYTLGYVGHSWRGRGKKIVLGRDVEDGPSVLLTTLADFFEHVTPKAISTILEQYGAGKTES